MITPNNQKEKKAFLDFEKEIQNNLDKYYLSRNHKILRDPDKLHDLKIDGIDVEEKIRDGIFSDAAIEIVQDLISGDIGWFTKTECKFLHYIMCLEYKPIYLYRINWDKFKNWMIDEFLPKHKIGKYCYSSRGWGATINILVPIKEIPNDIIEKYEINNG